MQIPNKEISRFNSIANQASSKKVNTLVCIKRTNLRIQKT
jgi:hypothetical protein